MTTILKVNIVVVMALLLLACGGGGSSSSDTGGSGGSGGSPASSDATLSDLSISPGSLDQIFQSNQATYTTTLGYPVASVQVTPTTGDDGASLTVNGVATKSGMPSSPVALPEGESTLITVQVTAADGTTTQSYSIDVTREQATSFAQQAYIKASNGGTDDFFGHSVALDGNTLAVGAIQEDGDASSTTGNPNDDASEAGAVYVFYRSGGVWSEQAYIKASNADSGDRFGFSVALDGDTLVVGAFSEDGDANSTAASPNDNAQSAGATYVFTRSTGVWSQQAYLKASNAASHARFGVSIAVDGDTLLVGANGEQGDINSTAATPNNNAGAAGAAYIFTRSAGVWSQQAYLKASNADSGDAFGVSVALDGNALAVGANGERGDANSTATNPNDNAQGAGAAYVFTRSAGVWSQQVYLKASNAGTEDRFGVSVALDGDTVVVGADREDGDINSTAASPNDNGRNAGAVYVFTRSAGDWSQQAYLKASTGTPDQFGHLFGGRVALENDTVVVGAGAENGDANSTSANPNNFATNSGAAYVFTRTGGVWSDLAYLKASNAGSNDGFLVVALDGDTVAVGASGESGDASSTATNPNDNALNAGAVYLFR
ncbi:cadherin-like beta sandwich domain-containing protein [Marinobacter changyiensis]|uniref:cadherin-like beta sandwich domain-containing protein n=1 Tax=Marinobacter changyiensis TaxID=2604091 RepID=UPI0015D3D74A|nr:cadherin-like beta sandwich domain-containing protein [Marinobacter changyiensis]